MRIPLAANFYQHPDRQFSSQRLVNQYLEVGDAQERTTTLIRGTPGATLFSNTSGKLRGLRESTDGETLYAIVGTSFYTIDADGVASAIGTVEGDDYVDIIINLTQVMIAAGLVSYIYTPLSGTFVQIADSDFPGASCGIYMDGYAIIAKPDSTQSNVSSADDFSTWDALDFTNETTSPDNILMIRDDRKEFWVFKKKTIVPYSRTGSGNYPFQRVSSTILEMGCIAPRTVAVADNTYFWVGYREAEGGIGVWRASGYQPSRISTHAIENRIESFGDITAAIAFTYLLNGHLFYVLNFPSKGTFVFDVATSLWHEWIQFGEEWSTFTHHAFFNNRHIVGGPDGVLYSLSNAVYTSKGDVIQRRMITPVYDSDGKQIKASYVEIEVEAGVGLNTGQGSDPKMMLRWSKNGGLTYSNEYWRSVGRVGEYGARCMWRNLGRSREWVLETVYSEPTQYALLKAYADVTVGAP